MAGLRKYQEAARPDPVPPPPCAAACGAARLLHFGADNGRHPVVFIPSLINPPAIFDLSEKRSMLRHMAAAGHDAYLVDWGTPEPDDADLGLDHHVTERLMPLLAGLPRPPVLVGYCLGGSLTLGAARAVGAKAVATIATPWRFDAFPEEDRSLVIRLWTDARAVCERLGYVPMEVLQSGFWAMDPARTIRKYAAFTDMEPGSEAERAFLAVEDWANQGAPLTFAAGRDLFERLYADNVSGRGLWQVAGERVEPQALSCPSLSIVSASDRIVPAAAGPALAEQWCLSLGHVGMVVSGRAREMLWRPLSLWLSSHGG
ncbi:alpha/beta hydrolase [Sphingobium amiense]|uniref:Alpha/beta hydrolase n=2 Tax=Sphingobium amiense TaxID=135719 RepID=A0A494WAM1_9SPHN|nr:alpha/beta hydrolase [Sphingobium amiense]